MHLLFKHTPHLPPHCTLEMHHLPQNADDEASTGLNWLGVWYAWPVMPLLPAKSTNAPTAATSMTANNAALAFLFIKSPLYHKAIVFEYKKIFIATSAQAIICQK
jgi:hypothetical protein